VEGTWNWSAGWLPGLYQGTVVRTREPRILNLEAPANLRGKGQRNYLDFLGTLNREHGQARPGELDLEARIASFELAARMQTSASGAMDISNESAATKKLYGIDRAETKEFGTRCLFAAQGLQKNRSSHRRIGEGPEAARPARQHRGALGRRDGPAAGGAE
jgi:hypothetical protein